MIKRKKNIKKIVGRVILYLLALVIAIYVLAPYVWMVITSISTKNDLSQIPIKWFPTHPTLQNYVNILMGKSNVTSDAAAEFIYGLKNSAIVASAVTLITLLIGTPASYAFAKLNFIGKNKGLVAIIVTQMIPPIAILLPLYMIMLKLHLMDNLLSLIIIYLSFILPFVIWIMEGYFAGIPDELEEAARIDGCTKFGALIKIILPIASSGLAVTVIFAFIISWNEFFYALNFTSTLAAKTLPVIITEFSDKHGQDYILTSTGGVIASLPPVILAMLTQKLIIKGLTAGAVKG
jgi:multiple sugar transport system permease protein